MEDVIIEERTVSVPAKEEPKRIVKKVVVRNKKKYGFWSYIFNVIRKALISGLFVAINFLLFCGAGNYDIFYGRDILPEVSNILYAIFIVAFIVVFLLSFSRFLLNLFTAFVGGFFVLMMMGHFAQFNTSSFLQPFAENYLGGSGSNVFAQYSGLVAAGLTSLLLLLFFVFASTRKVTSFVFILILVFGGISFNQFMTSDKKEDPKLIYADKVVATQDKGKKFIYIALPNLSSYSHLKSLSEKHPSAKTTLNAMNFLFNANNFAVYPNAYAVSDDDALNIAQSLNLQLDGDFLNDKQKYKKAWNFEDVADQRPQLKSAKLMDMFEKTGYVVSVFEAQDIDLCYYNDEELANKCYQKRNVPVVLDNGKFTVKERTMVLFGEWLESTGLFSGYPGLYKFANSIINVDDVPMLGMSYKNMSVVDSLKIFDIVAQDVSNVKGNKAYFINLDIPSDMYIYDEFCQIKPLKEWVPAQETYGRNVDLLKKRDAYFEQSACLYGKLNDFVKKIKDSGEGVNTVIVLQGSSGLNDYDAKSDAERFMNDKSITFAIRDPKHKRFSIMNKFCSAPDLLNQYFRKKACSEFNGLEYEANVIDEVKTALLNNAVAEGFDQKTYEEFGLWYRNWLRANYPDMIIPIEMPLLEEVSVDKNLLQKPADAKEVKVEQNSTSLKNAIKNEAVNEINYVNEQIVDDKKIINTSSDQAGSKVIIKIDGNETKIEEIDVVPFESENFEGGNENVSAEDLIGNTVFSEEAQILGQETIPEELKSEEAQLDETIVYEIEESQFDEGLDNVIASEDLEDENDGVDAADLPIDDGSSNIEEN